MKKLILIALVSLLFLFGCNKNGSKEIEKDDSTKDVKVDESTDENKDKYGRVYQDGAIIIKSEELRNTLLDFLTAFSVGDKKMLDYLYLSDEQKEGFSNLLSSEEGREIVSKIAEGTSIETDGIPDAIFLKSEMDENGNCFKSETKTNITAEGPSYRNFIEVLKAKNEKPFSDYNAFKDYLDRFIEYYPAKNKLFNAFDFCYVNGKPVIAGDTFIEYFGIFKDVDKSTKEALDLVKNGYLPAVAPEPEVEEVLEPLSKSEYIKAYDILKNKRVNNDWDFDPNPTVKGLFTSPDEVRAKFLSDMRKLPNPLIKTFVDADGNKKTMVIYYYEDNYSPEATGLMTEEIFTMHDLEDLSGVMFENIVNNTLAKQK